MKHETTNALADTVVVLDFETTGLSPAQGDRAIEIGAVKIVGGRLVERFQKLMNPGFAISGFISQYTGITNAMLRNAAPCGEVMAEFHEFLGDHNLVAHNASFDRKFLDAELARISRSYAGRVSCSMLLSRRILHDAPNHKLETLVRHLHIQAEGVFHRALYDAEMAGRIWLAMLERIAEQAELDAVPFELAEKLCKATKPEVRSLLKGSARSRETAVA